MARNARGPWSSPSVRLNDLMKREPSRGAGQRAPRECRLYPANRTFAAEHYKERNLP